MKRKLANTLSPLLKIALAVGLLVYLFRSGRFDPASFKALITFPVIATGLFTIGVVLVFSSERWRGLLKQQGLPIGRAEALRLTLIGTFFNFFVPGGVGGDLIKAVFVAKNHPKDRGKAVLTVAMDRVFGLFTMTFLALVSFVFEPELLQRDSNFQFIFLALAIIFLGFLFGFWVLLSSHATTIRDFATRMLNPIPKLAKLWGVAQTYRLTLKEFLGLSILSIGSQLTQILLFLVVAQQLEGQPPSLSVFLFVVPVGFMVTAVPIAPAGIGIGQAAFAFLFSRVLGRETDIGVIGVTAFQAFLLCYGLIGALLFVSMKKKNHDLTIHNLEEAAERLT